MFQDRIQEVGKKKKPEAFKSLANMWSGAPPHVFEYLFYYYY